MRVLLVSSEAAPLARTGGLGDVLGSLPGALKALGLAPEVVLPRYATPAIEAAARRGELVPVGEPWPVALGRETLAARAWSGRLGGVPCHLVENRELFGRPGLYGENGTDYPDNDRRFAFFCRALPGLAARLKIEVRVVHVHDWQAALLPALLAGGQAEGTPLAGAASVLTVHNLAFQGLFPPESFALTGLPAGFFTMEGLEFWGRCNFLKAGLSFARALTTVSPSYAREIQTPAFGCGLEGVLAGRARDLTGILNGVDYASWSPERDPSLPARYAARALAGKTVCRDALLAAFRLDPAGPATMVLGMVNRLTSQKGVDLILEVLEEGLPGGGDWRLCVLGAGDPALEGGMGRLAARHFGRVGFRMDFDDALARLVYAGSDAFLLPSRFEPCGLGQLYALAYGTPPVVRATGGLRDSVAPWEPGQERGTGFVFGPPDAPALAGALKAARRAFADRAAWRGLVARGMAQDFSWEKSARQYAALYARLAEGPRPR